MDARPPLGVAARFSAISPFSAIYALIFFALLFSSFYFLISGSRPFAPIHSALVH
jgi:hypothetical protein